MSFIIPSPWSLLQAIDFLFQFANKSGVRTNKAMWLVHVNFFLKIPIKKSIIDINFLDFHLNVIAKKKIILMVVGFTTR